MNKAIHDAGKAHARLAMGHAQSLAFVALTRGDLNEAERLMDVAERLDTLSRELYIDLGASDTAPVATRHCLPAAVT